MWTEVQDAITSLLPAKRKTSGTGWISFNAPCCVHNGETPDTRGRGGLIFNGQGVVNYHCFNCSFKSNYTPGRHLNYKFKKLLSWMGADENTVKRLVIEAMRIKDLIAPEDIAEEPKEEIVIKPRDLPKDTINLSECVELYNELPHEMQHAIDYAQDRGVDLSTYDLLWTPEESYNLHRRVIVPITWRNRTMGYTARAFDPKVKPKYHNNYENKLVFNLDKQLHTSRIVIVCEGPFDAIAIDGVATLGNNISDVQADLIESLDKQVIVVPDQDDAGQGLVRAALNYGWNVSFPVWQNDYKDINDAVCNLGKLFVLRSIISGVESNPLKIKLRRKINV